MSGPHAVEPADERLPSARGAAPAPVVPAPTNAGTAAFLLRLQATAGNSAVVAYLAEQAKQAPSGGGVVRRDPDRAARYSSNLGLNLTDGPGHGIITREAVVAYVQNPRNPQKERFGLARAWNRGLAGEEPVALPEIDDDDDDRDRRDRRGRRGRKPERERDDHRGGGAGSARSAESAGSGRGGGKRSAEAEPEGDDGTPAGPASKKRRLDHAGASEPSRSKPATRADSARAATAGAGAGAGGKPSAMDTSDDGSASSSRRGGRRRRRRKKSAGLAGGVELHDTFDPDTDYSDSEGESEYNEKFAGPKLLNWTKKKYRERTKDAPVEKVNNFVETSGLSAAVARLGADAAAIRETIPERRSKGATTITCAILARADGGGYRRFAFCNQRLMKPTCRAEAEKRGYHVVRAFQAHSEGEMIQYLKSREGVYELYNMGVDKAHCVECVWAMEHFFESAGGYDTTAEKDDADAGDKPYKRWYNPPSQYEALDLPSAATPLRPHGQEGPPKRKKPGAGSKD